MTDYAAQAHAIFTTVGFRNRPDLLLCRLEGDDQRSWLNGQVTGDVRTTQKGESLYCLAVNVRGRILADIWVLDEGDHLSLLVPLSASEALLSSFESQIIMEDVEVVPWRDTRVVSVLGPQSQQLSQTVAAHSVRQFPGDELGQGGLFLLAEEPECETLLQSMAAGAQRLGGGPTDDAGYELARLRAQVPRFSADFDLKTYPQEAGLKDRAVAFNKGCYLGQEVVCTLENRGKLARALFALTLDGEASPMAPLTLADGTSVGHVTSIVWDPDANHWRALGYVKVASAQSGQTLTCGRAQVSIVARVGDS